MTVSLKHTFASAKPDSADPTIIQPSNWNQEHVLTAAAGKVLGRDTSGAGNVQELPISVTSAGNVTIPNNFAVTGTTGLTGTTTLVDLNATGTVGFTNALGVTSGGTGLATLPANNVLIGNGTSAVASVAPSTLGNVLTSNGTAWTSAAAPSAVVSFPQNSQTASYTLVISDQGKQISITTGGITIPANSSVAFPIGSTICFFNNSSSNQFISITTDTLREAGTAATGTRMLAQYGFATCVKVASTTWVISGAEPFSVEYLVVAGGGGGARYGGGGGAGGFLTGTFTPVVSGTAYTVTVGAGGAAAVSGNNSVFGSVLSFGGGRGGAFNDINGRSGGSGGGGCGGPSGTGTGGAGTLGQGNSGGGGASYRGGGGGGAGAVGADAGGAGGNGGAGLSSSISGSSVSYAGGGGGAQSGVGGTGGGGNGASGTGTAGTANRGGGGGGGNTAGGAGGSGVVIIRYPDALANASSTTGSPTLTTTGGYKIYTFTASGTITW
jgi:hypothetical protein